MGPHRSVFLLAFIAAPLWCYQNTLDGRPEATSKRLRSPAQVVVDGAAQAPEQKAPAPLAPGEAVYRKYCSVCHSQGIAGAPKTGDQSSWQKRLDQGWATLLKHAVVGYKGMPAKGHCMKCSEHDIEEAIEYMLLESGIENREKN